MLTTVRHTGAYRPQIGCQSAFFVRSVRVARRTSVRYQIPLGAIDLAAAAELRVAAPTTRTVAVGCVRLSGTMFVADAFAGWLIGQVADAGRRRLAPWLLGSDQQRALQQAATAAIQQLPAGFGPAMRPRTTRRAPSTWPESSTRSSRWRRRRPSRWPITRAAKQLALARAAQDLGTSPLPGWSCKAVWCWLVTKTWWPPSD